MNFFFFAGTSTSGRGRTEQELSELTFLTAEAEILKLLMSVLWKFVADVEEFSLLIAVGFLKEPYLSIP